MTVFRSDATVVVVLCAGVGAVAKDRPLAELLQGEIDRRGGGVPHRRAVVVDDGWFLEHPQLHGHPTIAIGGPGANGVTGTLLPRLPIIWRQGEESFVQADLEGSPKRAALWGMDAGATAAALTRFVEGGALDEMLSRVWVGPGEWQA
jgi:hypothetical protein